MRLRLALGSPAKSLAGRRIRFVSVLGVGTISSFFLLAACGEQPQELDERVTQLQKELDRTQGELRSTTQALQASKEELTRLKTNPSSAKRETASPPPISSTLPSREALEASYMAEAKALKKQLQSQLKDLTLGSFTLHNVQLPDSQFPITSWISLAFQTGDGKQYRVDFAVKADSKGAWVFPETAEIARAAEAKKTAATSDTSESRAPKPGPNEPPPNVPTLMPSNTTSVIQWPNSSSPPASRDTAKTSDPGAKQNPVTAPPGPQTAPAQSPKQTIPAADRDVLIRF